MYGSGARTGLPGTTTSRSRAAAKASTRDNAVGASSTASGASRDPSGPESGSGRVVRGGSWGRDAGLCRSAFRLWSGPGYRGGNLGFRLSRKV
jgi:formylglycine-generating enzyme required for sulfatase activity